ncbi:MAG TPA: hypothetical protein DDZ51_15105 [Planctomycetaceae bacterium]|nr:hypothetical protein [Planctomycetaceae bacterium]
MIARQKVLFPTWHSDPAPTPIMSIRHLQSRHEAIELPFGQVLGCSYRWPGGQYCVIHTDRGIVGCGLYDCSIASQFGFAIAIARGTPTHPLCEPEDLLNAKIADVSKVAQEMGIRVGMLGIDALKILMAESNQG